MSLLRGSAFYVAQFRPQAPWKLSPQVLTWVVVFYRPPGLKDRQKAKTLMVS